MIISEIEAAAAVLAAGGLVGFPTETVYGLGANAADPKAIAAIYALKGRPTNHPVIVHLHRSAVILDWASDIPAYAYALIEAVWPGPLTLVLPRAAGVSDAITGGQNTVGLRCPAHPLAQALLQACLARGVPGLAAPSANRFGRVSPTTAAHVRQEFGATLPLLDGGPCQVGIESTIIDCSAAAPVLLRPGAVSAAQISAITGLAVQTAHVASPRASGGLPAHYQPATPVALIRDLRAVGPQPEAALYAKTKPVHFLGQYRPAPANAAAYAQDLYAALRALDALHCQQLLIEIPGAGAQPIEHSLWLAVLDRLQRAASVVAI